LDLDNSVVAATASVLTCVKRSLRAPGRTTIRGQLSVRDRARQAMRRSTHGAQKAATFVYLPSDDL
jgi:hypothetical protein